MEIAPESLKQLVSEVRDIDFDVDLYATGDKYHPQRAGDRYQFVLAFEYSPGSME